jgi:cytochrome c553
MNMVRFRVVLQTAILAVFFALAVHSDAEETCCVLEAKADYCTDCHGPSGQGYLGWYPMPRLAGQQPAYFEKQLQSFQRRNRESEIEFIYKVHALNPGMGSALAFHFGSLRPEPFGGAPNSIAGIGRRIYEEGVPEGGIPACAACHGPNAEGKGLNPRLAGQLYPYLVKELTNWRTERAQEAPSESVAVMTPIATAMTKRQIEAVSAYLASKH